MEAAVRGVLPAGFGGGGGVEEEEREWVEWVVGGCLCLVDGRVGGDEKGERGGGGTGDFGRPHGVR